MLAVLMALAFTTSSNDQAGTLAAGTHTGHVLVNHARCTLTGAGIDATTIVLDGTYNTAVRAVANRETFTLRDLTIDCAQLSSIVGVLEANAVIPIFRVQNVKIVDHYRGTYAVANDARFEIAELTVVGSGGGIYHNTNATVTQVRGMTVIGGRYGFVNVGGNGIDLADMDVRLDYWAAPTYESVTVTSYDALGANVASHVQADRGSGDIMRHLRPVLTFDTSTPLRSSLVRLYDRIEMANGTWTQVVDFATDGSAVLDDWRSSGLWRPTSTPSGTATVYRPILGRLVYQDATRLYFQSGSTPTSPRWRYVDGSTAPTPDLRTGSRLDVIRHGDVDNRDTDTGAFHVTETAVNARLLRCTATGGASDTITLRGVGTVAESCSTYLGYDMGFTVDGTDGRMTLRTCQARRTGRAGFHLTGGPSDLYSCGATANGTINDGSGDYGVTTTAACVGSTLQVRGTSNLDGLLGGTVTTVSSGGFEEPASVVASRAAPAFIYKHTYGGRRR